MWAGSFLVLAVCLTACDGGRGEDQRRGAPLPIQDSVATAREIKASVAGAVAPGGQAYSFRGLYAGMSRSQVEQRVPLPSSVSDMCLPTLTPPGELACMYDVVLGADSARARLEIQYGALPARGERLARTITIARELPLDVDGVRLARALSDAFAAQTALLDKRDASYGRHQAQVRMGTVNGARKNYVDLSVMPRGSRELLTVKMSRL